MVEEDGDEIFTPMPAYHTCTIPFPRVKPINGFMCCEACGVSFGPVPPTQEELLNRKLAQLYPTVEPHWRRYRHALDTHASKRETERARKYAWEEEEKLLGPSMKVSVDGKTAMRGAHMEFDGKTNRLVPTVRKGEVLMETSGGRFLIKTVR